MTTVTRTCIECGSAFRGQTRKCSGCQAVERRCISCGDVFTSRYLKCKPCRISPGICEIAECANPKMPGRGAKLCEEHRDGVRLRKAERLRNAICNMPGCTEPKRTGTTPGGRRRPYRYCEKHSAEAPWRESIQVVRRKRERDYGLTHDEYMALLEEQGGVCAICGSAEDGDRSLSVDHDHVTGAVRGLLCNRCNPMLGYARDSITVLNAAIAYLEKANC